jgi:hypothetical protein
MENALLFAVLGIRPYNAAIAKAILGNAHTHPKTDAWMVSVFDYPPKDNREVIAAEDRYKKFLLRTWREGAKLNTLHQYEDATRLFQTYKRHFMEVFLVSVAMFEQLIATDRERDYALDCIEETRLKELFTEIKGNSKLYLNLLFDLYLRRRQVIIHAGMNRFVDS